MELLDDPMVLIVGPEVSDESAKHPTGFTCLGAGCWMD